MQTIATNRRRPAFGAWIFRLIYITLIIVGALAYNGLREESAAADRELEKISNTPVVAGKVKIGESFVVIPSDKLFDEGQMWSLASKKHPLSSSFEVVDLVKSPVATGGNEDLKVSARIAKPLSALVAAAEEEGYELMMSSAYRSIADQQTTYDSFVKQYGKEMAASYVSPPGSSEHHTGLAIDLSDASPDCTADSDDCSLGMTSAEWLMANAPNYGFILRYPEGKQPITGVGYEWWHFRYVGIPLAKAMASSDLTLDEAVDRMQTVLARE